jgi:hypothetical protein
MSHIPNSAMPHAGPQPETGTGQDAGSESRFGRVADLGSGIADKVREYPKTAAVAGAAVVGLAAAAAIPAIRGRGRSEEKGAKKSSKND